MEETLSIHDLMAILRRRKWFLILPFVIVFLGSLVAVVVIPPTYQSTSTILIEDQSLPREFVASIVSGFAEQRLQLINQRIMSTTKLTEIINRFNLYAEYQKSFTMDEIVALMRKDTKFETISANVVDSRTGQPKVATIAFSLSYEGKRPELVQQVAAALASLYLEENLMVREQQTTGAYKFLEDESNSLKSQLSDIDAKISTFKSRNVTALPELFQANMQVLDQIGRDIDAANMQLASLKEKQSYLQSQLAAMPADAADSDLALLKNLKTNLIQMQSRLSDQHPDVIKTKADIAELEARMKSRPKAKSGDTSTDFSENQAYVALKTQLAGVEADISLLRQQVRDLNVKRDMYRGRIDHSPKVDEQYKTLLVERSNTQMKFDDLMKKSLEARVSQGLEKDQMGERFTLIDPARLPEKPIKPNVPVILMIGLILGIGSGVGVTSLRELTDNSVRHVKDLTRHVDAPVLGALPEIITWEDQNREGLMRRNVLIAVGVVFLAGILIVHFFIMDLDIVWAKVMRRLLA